jgi:hypothetical protein
MAEKLTIIIDLISDPTQVTGRLMNNLRRVTATVPESEGRRLIAELAAAGPKALGQQPITVEVMPDQLTSISE